MEAEHKLQGVEHILQGAEHIHYGAAHTQGVVGDTQGQVMGRLLLLEQEDSPLDMADLEKQQTSCADYIALRNISSR